MELKEQLLFLQNLKEELNSQTHDSQASPRFWVVRDYKEEPCWEGNAEYHHIASNDICVYGDVNSFKEDLKINGYLDELSDDAIEELNEIVDEEVLVVWLEEQLKIESYIVPMHTVDVIKKDTFFITKRECQEHIKRNQHHYSSKAHTYAMTAWRSPQVEKLWEVLETLDVEKLIESI